MMIDATKLYDEWGDKKKAAPGQWLQKKETQELIKTFDFNWHKEDKVYFFDESLFTFYSCYINPQNWIKVIAAKNNEVEVIKEVEKPFDETYYFRELLKNEYSKKPNEVIKSIRNLTKRETRQLLDVFEVNGLSDLFDKLSLQFVRIILSYSIIDNISVDKFFMSYIEVLLGSFEGKNIYLTPGFRIKITQGTETKYC